MLAISRVARTKLVAEFFTIGNTVIFAGVPDMSDSPPFSGNRKRISECRP